MATPAAKGERSGAPLFPAPPTRLAVLLGDPVAHSLSPRIHNAAFRALGIDAEYRAWRVAPDGVADAIATLRAHHALGANVTIPHKRAVLGLVDRLTPAASAIGAVNTLRVESEGTLVGDNTDADGFALPLLDQAESLAGTTMTILGAGGAARAVVYALLTRFGPERVVVAARRLEQARRLIASFSDLDPNGGLEATTLDAAREAVRESALVVNTTPVGMTPRPDGTPWPHAEDFHPGQTVYDLVYAPEETRLLREASARGARTVGGLAMLIGQAAVAFESWTGQAMPLDVVRDALA